MNNIESPIAVKRLTKESFSQILKENNYNFLLGITTDGKIEVLEVDDQKKFLVSNINDGKNLLLTSPKECCDMDIKFDVSVADDKIVNDFNTNLNKVDQNNVGGTSLPAITSITLYSQSRAGGYHCFGVGPYQTCFW